MNKSARCVILSCCHVTFSHANVSRRHPVPLVSYQNAAHATQTYTQTAPATKCCPCHANVHRQHPVPLVSYQNAAHAAQSTPRCRQCCACHEVCKPPPQRCACHAKPGPQSRARQHPVPLHSYQMLPPCQTNVHPDAGDAGPATKFASHLQSAAPATQNGALSRALDNIQCLYTAHATQT